MAQFPPPYDQEPLTVGGAPIGPEGNVASTMEEGAIAKCVSVWDFVIYLFYAAIFGLGVLPGIAVIVIAGVTHQPWLHVLEHPTANESALIQFVLDASLLLPILFIIKVIHKASLSQIGWIWPRAKWYPIAVGVTAVSIVAEIVLTNIQDLITHSVPNTQCNQVQSMYGHGILFAILGACVFAPIAEETVFRGFVFGWLRKHCPVWLSAIISGLIFSLAHYEPQLIWLLWILGTSLAVLYYYAKSTVPGMVVHGLFNLVGIISIIYGTCPKN